MGKTRACDRLLTACQIRDERGVNLRKTMFFRDEFRWVIRSEPKAYWLFFLE